MTNLIIIIFTTKEMASSFIFRIFRKNSKAMNKDTMIQALVNLYDRRLRKLLYYDQEHYTCKLIERMFCRFDELTEQGHRRYAANINRYIGAILEHNEERSKQVESILALHEIRTLLELYIKSTIVEFWPEEKDNLDALNPKYPSASQSPGSKPLLDYRGLLGRKIGECQKKHPKLFPQQLNIGVLVQQLKHITEVRNKKIHGESVGLTTKFNRYTFLGAIPRCWVSSSTPITT